MVGVGGRNNSSYLVISREDGVLIERSRHEGRHFAIGNIAKFRFLKQREAGVNRDAFR